MRLAIGGMGWVTPLGSGVPEVWQRLMNGETAVAETISSPLSDHTYPVFRVPPEAIADAPAHPRLRRSSAISRFAVVAGLAALKDARVDLDDAAAERTAIIFAISNGGVVYTKRFYHEVVESGAQAASPLLFPETVFNAPASHLAAILGITGASYTLVGDGAVGLLALKMAEDLMQNPALDRCLVVGAEEADWLLCDAYRRWHLLRAAPPVELFQDKPRGMILSEGAGAVLLETETEGRASARPGRSEDRPSASTLRIEQIDSGCNFRSQKEAAACVEEVLSRLGANDHDLIIASANGTFVDRAERAAMTKICPRARVYSPKVSLGESVGASSLWQIICAAQALATKQLPPMPHASGEKDLSCARAVLSSCALNQQVAGLSLSRSKA
ncbi:MAG: hypothetical protein M3Y86_03675 [Verrucomicrobiota bacterium]|nr:hypothetical protein [Verrucomicrobiota bacterium]